MATKPAQNRIARLAPVYVATITVIAYAILQPAGADITNSEIVRYAKMGGWAVGPVAAILSGIAMLIINTFRRIVRLHQIKLLDAIVALVCIGFWLVVSWNITGEPRYTSIAKAIIDFAARPLLWGSLLTCGLVLLHTFVSLFKKS